MYVLFILQDFLPRTDCEWNPSALKHPPPAPFVHMSLMVYVNFYSIYDYYYHFNLINYRHLYIIVLVCISFINPPSLLSVLYNLYL